MRCFVVAEFPLKNASRGSSAIAEPLVVHLMLLCRLFLTSISTNIKLRNVIYDLFLSGWVLCCSLLHSVL